MSVLENLTMLELVFWLALSVVLYAYAGYPLLILLRGWLWPKPYRMARVTPKISLVICCHNEEQSIGEKLENVLALDYPEDELEVLVASDGSTDRTAEIVRGYCGPRVQLLELPRSGKARALNAAVARASGEILVFSDANSMYAADALREIVQPFADETVGGVAGNQVYRKSYTAGAAASGEQGYWSFDRWLKILQSRSGNTIRRGLFREVPEGVTDDFVTSTRVIEQGYRLVFAAGAVCHEPVAGGAKAEFGRKVRVITRGLRGVLAVRGLLNPLRYGFYSLQLFSHKVIRRLVAIPLVVLAIVTPLLWPAGWFYQLATLAEAAFVAAAAAGWLLARAGRRVPRLPGIPFYFCMVNAAVLCAVWNIARGRKIVVWDPHRGSETAGATSASNPSSALARNREPAAS